MIYLPKLRLLLPQHCNLHCKVCHQEHNSESFTTNAPVALHFLKKLERSFAIKHFNITGGEPFVQDNQHATRLFSEFIRSSFQDTTLSVNTNGLCLSSRDVKKIAYTFHYIKLTLFGSNKEEYFDYTGLDAYDKAVSSLSLLIEAGSDVRLNVLATRFVLSEETLFRYLKLAKKFGAPIKFVELISHNWFCASKKSYFESLFIPILLLEDKLRSIGLPIVGGDMNRTIFDFDGVPVYTYKCPDVQHGAQNFVFSHLLRSDGVSLVEDDTKTKTYPIFSSNTITSFEPY